MLANVFQDKHCNFILTGMGYSKPLLSDLAL